MALSSNQLSPGEFSFRKLALPAFGPSLMLGLVEGAIYPVLALSALQLGASAAAAGLIVALVSIGQTLANLPAAAIASRFGERRAMVGAALFGLVALVLCLVAPNAWWFGGAVFMIGLAAAVFKLARQTFLTEAAPLALRARAMSTLGGTVRVGMFAGPFIAAAFIHVMGLAGAYWSAILAMIGAGAIAFVVPDLPTSGATHRRRSSRLVMRHQMHTHGHVFATVGVATALVAAIRACRQIVIPLWAESIGLNATDTALIYGLMGAVDMLLFYPAGKVMDIWGRVWITLPSMVIMGASFMAVPFTSGFTSLLLVSMVMGFGNGIGSGLILTIGADASPRNGRTEFLGIWRVITDTGGGCGPLLLSGITAVASLASGIVAIGSLGFVASYMFWRWLPHRRERPGS
ncbi:MAG: MFS transporter [Burkholderiaceae bacterium]|nr:MAG: MFS transporter [Burkholderiaceae bacterium]